MQGDRNREENPTRKMNVARISRIVLGKQTAAFKEPWYGACMRHRTYAPLPVTTAATLIVVLLCRAAHVDDDLCFSIYSSHKVVGSPGPAVALQLAD